MFKPTNNIYYSIIKDKSSKNIVKVDNNDNNYYLITIYRDIHSGSDRNRKGKPKFTRRLYKNMCLNIGNFKTTKYTLKK